MASYIFSKLNPIPAFPALPGPYEVGTIDVELPVSLFVEDGSATPAPSHAADLSTIQFRIFYPTALKGKADPATRSAKWIPSPRREYLAAYGRFLGAGPFLANVLSYVPALLYYIDLPALAGAKILSSGEHGYHNVPEKLPVVVFSHGLGGTRNTYAYLTATTASHGAVIFVPEHRDGSGPTSFIREPKNVLKRETSRRIEADGIPDTPDSSGSSDREATVDGGNEGKITQAAERIDVLKEKASKSSSERKRIDYIIQAHEISDSTAAVRNQQLEVRLWELGVLYAAIQKLSSGWSEKEVDEDIYLSPSNKTSSDIAKVFNMFKGRLATEKPSSITWMGHSFGAATITQWVKSVWYWPKFRDSEELGEPLYIPSKQLLSHFHPDGTMHGKPPVSIILDLWCLPLLGERTRSLWELPLPGPTMGVLSQQFYRWRENLLGTRHVMNLKGGRDLFLAQDDTAVKFAPDSDEAKGNEESPQGKKLQRLTSLDITPQLPGGLSESDETKMVKDESLVEVDKETLKLQRTQSSVMAHGQSSRRLYYAKTSAHLSQSDFGILFPRSAKYFAKVDDSERVLHLNCRAIVEYMREQGFQLAQYGQDTLNDQEIFGEAELAGWELVSMDLDNEDVEKSAARSRTGNEETSSLSL